MNNYNNTEFIIFDVETTGLSPSGGDRIVEIAALKIKDFKPYTKFHSLINPQRDIFAGASAVNGITREMLHDAPTAQEVLPHFLKYIQNTVLVAYNAKFDVSFVANEVSLLGERFNETMAVIDVLKMARGLLPGLRQYPLWFVAQSLGVEEQQQHRALTDVMLTWEVFRKLIEIAERKNIHDVNGLTKLFAPQPGRPGSADAGWLLSSKGRREEFSL